MKSPHPIDVAFFLKKTPLFQDLSLQALLAIADCLQWMEVPDGKLIFNEGQQAHRMYFIYSGRVLLSSTKGKNEERGRGQFFGDESLFCEGARTYDVQGLEDSSLLTLSRSHLMAIIQEFPAVSLTFLRDYAARLSEG